MTSGRSSGPNSSSKAGLGARYHGSHLRRRYAQVGNEPDRANPGQPLSRLWRWGNGGVGRARERPLPIDTRLWRLAEPGELEEGGRHGGWAIVPERPGEAIGRRRPSRRQDAAQLREPMDRRASLSTRDHLARRAIAARHLPVLLLPELHSRACLYGRPGVAGASLQLLP